MGHGTGKADADGVELIPDITVVNGGAKVVHFYIVLKTPGARPEGRHRVDHQAQQRPAGATRFTPQIPRSLQIVAGIPLRVESLHVNAGYKSYARTGSSRPCARQTASGSTTSRSTTSTGQVAKFDGAVTCRS